jgi:SAM-dependent methyltransferase
MSLTRTTRMIALAASVAFCQPLLAADGFAPKIGQAGKDVIWVPTPDALVERMLDMAKVTDRDYVVDLGSGDGRTVIAAAKRGAQAVGIEYNGDMVEIAKRNAQAAGMAGKATFQQGDIFATDFSKATVVTMYLLSSLNLKLRPTLLKMKPGTRLVSHAFTMAEWDPDETATIEGSSAYLWIVPANVQGRWEAKGPNGAFAMTLEQTFQKVRARGNAQGRSADIGNVLLSGPEFSFTMSDNAGRTQKFQGTVVGDTIEGTVDGSAAANSRWSAKRVN